MNAALRGSVRLRPCTLAASLSHIFKKLPVITLYYLVLPWMTLFYLSAIAISGSLPVPHTSLACDDRWVADLRDILPEGVGQRLSKSNFPHLFLNPNLTLNLNR